MGKNKFFKKLIVAGLCAVTATATFGVTACGGNNNGDGDKHTCNFATAWSNDKDGHWPPALTRDIRKRTSRPSIPTKTKTASATPAGGLWKLSTQSKNSG